MKAGQLYLFPLSNHTIFYWDFMVDKHKRANSFGKWKESDTLCGGKLTVVEHTISMVKHGGGSITLWGCEDS